MYRRLRFCWIVECRTSSIIWIAWPLCSSGFGTVLNSSGIARAAEISGSGMIDRNSFCHSSQRSCTWRNMLPRIAPSWAPYTRLSFSSCIGK